jgi:hypothetical protein
MALFSLYVGDKSNPAGIALLARIIQTLLFWQTLLHRQRSVAHGVPQLIHKAKNKAAHAAT